MSRAVTSISAALVLEIDPDLGWDLDPAEREVARQSCHGELLHVPRGPWLAAAEADRREGLVAFVVVDGLLSRELILRDHHMVELLGHTDVLQPPIVTEPRRLGAQTRLTAVSDLVLLVLGQPFVLASARWPTLLTALHRRLECQRESLAIQGLITLLPNAEHRLLLMLWQLSDRWGYVTTEGTVLPLPLNHEILGLLIGARRPTVTIALRHLEAAAAVHRRKDGSWLLTAVAARMLNAVASPSTVSRGVGERLMLFRQISQTTAQGRALRAEARQIRSQRPSS